MTAIRTLMKMVIKTTWTTVLIFPMPTKLTMTKMAKEMLVIMMMTMMASLMIKITVDWLSTQINWTLMVRIVQCKTKLQFSFLKDFCLPVWEFVIFS